MVSEPLPLKTSLKKKFALYLGSGMMIVLAAIFFWVYQQVKKGIYDQLDQQARSLLQQVIITRLWVADHGGLFVRQQPGGRPNPFLEDTEIYDRDGNTYLYQNPAMVTREISEYASRKGLYKFRLTSLKLKNPSNAPLPFEKEALLQFKELGFEQASQGISLVGEENGKPVYRLIIPLRVETSCLKCHADQRYTEGEVRGGLSVTIPMGNTVRIIRQNQLYFILSGVLITFCVLAGLYYLLNILVLSPLGHLYGVAQQLLAGKYTAKSDIHSKDEFEALSCAFNDMTDKLLEGYEGTIRSLMAAVDARDPYTKGHTARVGHYSLQIGKEMGLDDELLAEIRIGAILHDVGKIGIPDEILLKDSALTDEERAEIQSHVSKGVEIVGDVEFLQCIIPAVLYHHERIDGNGYPDGLKKEHLPLISRIIAVADTFDAMTTDRPYSKAVSKAHAIHEIEKNAGTQFDHEVVAAFVKVLRSDTT